MENENVDKKERVSRSVSSDLLGCSLKVRVYSSFGMGTFTGKVESVGDNFYMVRADERFSRCELVKVLPTDIVEIL